MAPVKIRHKQTPKQNRVVDELRRGILDGTLKPQTRLPSQSEIAHQFKVSGVTAHLAITRLAREGFVYSQKRHGTFVAEKPPHLNTYALVFWNDPVAYSGQLWSRYYMALTNEAIRLQQNEGLRIHFFHGIDEHADSEDRQRLLSYIESRRLGGIIFANSPFNLTGTTILEQPGIPRVSLSSDCTYLNVPAVGNDHDMWIERALDHLVAQGRKRIAVIMVGTGYNRESLPKLAEQRGVSIPSYWQHSIGQTNFAPARNVVELLLRGDPASRPDGLIIWDDNIVEHSLAGLVAAGVRVPDDVAVVAQCNFPWPPPSVLPVTRLGYDFGRLLRTSIDLLDRQRRGESVPRETILPALFEEEFIQQQGRVRANSSATPP